MSQRFSKVSRPKGAKTWMATLGFPDGTSKTYDTGLEDKREALKQAKYRLRQRIAHQRHQKRAKFKRRGETIPAELQPLRPGRRKPAAAKVETPPAAPPAPPKKKIAAAAKAKPLDSQAVAQRLAGLQGGAEFPDAKPEAPPAAPPPAPEIGDNGQPVVPPLPDDEETPEPETPEVLGAEFQQDREANNLAAQVYALGIITGYVAGVRKFIEKKRKPPARDWRAGRPDPGSISFMQKGLANKIAQAMEMTGYGDGAKIVIGAAGIALSMIFFAEPADQQSAAAASAQYSTASPEQQQADVPQSPAPPAAPPEPPHQQQQQLAPRNGVPSVGRFR